MWVNLLDFNEGVVTPTIHCHTLSSLRGVIDIYPDNYLKVYLYIFYKTCPDPDKNPFFNLPENDKDEIILKEINADFSVDDPVITEAIDFCNKAYDTPTRRAYEGAKIMMDKVASLFKTGNLTTGRDGSLDSMIRTMEKYQNLRESFKGVEKDYMDEIKAVTRGGSYVAYDQK